MSQLNEGVDHPISGQLKSPVWQRLGQMTSRPVPDMIGSTGNRQRLLKELGRLILRYRWLLMIALSLFYVFLELTEHLANPHGINMMFHAEFWLFSIFIPLLGGLVLTVLEKTDKERNRAMNALALEVEVSAKLSSCRTWDELRNYLLRFPLKVASFRDIWLLLYDGDRAEFQQVARWSKFQSSGPSMPPSFFLAAADYLTNDGLRQLGPEYFPDLDLPDDCAVYSLPLMHGKHPVALYILSLPAPFRLSEHEIKLLDNFAPAMAIAIDALHPYGSRMIEAEAVAGEQQRLSRYLHDSIAQELSYLLLKLEQLQDDEFLEDSRAVKKELVRLHEVANQAYIETRDIIATLYPFSSGDLASVIDQKVKLLKDGETQLNVTIDSDGKPQPLSPFLQRGMLSILHEALTNAQKHARATEFVIQLHWEKRYLTMSMRDNGKGLSSLSGGETRSGYGLRVMKERACEMNGQLDIANSPAGGTVVTVQVPLEADVVYQDPGS